MAEDPNHVIGDTPANPLLSTSLWALFPVRLIFYAAVEALALQGIVFTAGVYGPDLFNEDGPLEWLHFFVITTSALLLLWSSHRKNPKASRKKAADFVKGPISSRSWSRCFHT